METFLPITPAVQYLFVLFMTIILFTIRKIPLWISSICISIICWSLSFIDINLLFNFFIQDTYFWYLISLFIICSALFYTGLINDIGKNIVAVLGKKETPLLIAIMVVATIFSMVMGIFIVVLCLIPIVTAICKASNISPSRLMIPLIYAASLGSTIMLIGNPINIITTASLSMHHFKQLGFFEFAWIGIPLSIIAILYMSFIGIRLLPNNKIASQGTEYLMQELTPNNTNRYKKILCSIIMLVVVYIFPLTYNSFFSHFYLKCFFIGSAILCIITRCLTLKQAYKSIQWNTLSLFIVYMILSHGFTSSGADKLLTEQIGHLSISSSPYIASIIIFIIINILSQFTMASPISLLFIIHPIIFNISTQNNISPYPLLLIALVASICTFILPIGSPSNILVQGFGQYKFTDYIKCGLGLTITCFITSLILIPLKWPF